MQEKLPAKLKPLFWSCQFESLNPERHRRTIVKRVLNYGDLEDLRWLVDFYGKKRLAELLEEEIYSSELKKPTRRLVEVLFKVNLPKNEKRSLN